MRKVTKKLLTLGFAAVLAISSSMTAFAGDWTYELHSTSEIANGKDDPTEVARINGDSTTVWDFNVNDMLVLTNSTNLPSGMKIYVYDVAYKMRASGYFSTSADSILIGDAVEGQPLDIYKSVEGFWSSERGVYLSNLQNLDENIKNDVLWGIEIANGPFGQATEASHGRIWVRLVGDRKQDTSDVTTADNGDWASNSTGWWIQYKDGSYLTNGWWQSPTSGLWYYMGADGYMVTDTVIDGCTINSDGVWVQ